MKFFVVVVLASALALAQGFSGIAFPEQMRDGLDGRIIQGTPAANGQFPHQAFLLISQSSGGRSACGGSLIGSRWVMTAAHCTKGFVSAVVHMGNVNYGSSPVQISTTNLHYHPNYNTANLNNDIGLIGLPNDVQESATVRVIKLANDVSQTFQDRVATVSGFGLTSDGGSVSPSLNHVDLNIISNSECQGYFGSSIIIASTVCATGIQSTAQGVCNGDSGGPLILEVDGVLRQIGVVSFVSSAGCSSSYPSGFVRCNHFLPWIKQVTGLDFP